MFKIPLASAGALFAAAALCAACTPTATIRTDPSGAEVFVNGQPAGHSPTALHSSAGPPKRMRIQLRREGYRDEEFFLDADMDPAMAVLGAITYGVTWFWGWDLEDSYTFRLRPMDPGPFQVPAKPAKPVVKEAPEPAEPAEPAGKEAPKPVEPVVKEAPKPVEPVVKEAPEPAEPAGKEAPKPAEPTVDRAPKEVAPPAGEEKKPAEPAPPASAVEGE